MALACFRFYEELNDFLAEPHRKREFVLQFERRASVKDMVESLGVPHTEVELILVNGVSVDFSYIVLDGDRVSVYPMFESLDVSSLIRLRQHPLRDPRFVVDANLGRLARYLRLLGFDTCYRNNYTDEEVAKISARERRIVLTRDRALLKRAIITHGCFIRANDPVEQVKEVLRRLDLGNAVKPFRRCSLCNGEVVPVHKSEIESRLLPKTRRYYEEFYQCQCCGQVYWKGPHYERGRQLIRSLLLWR